VTTTHDLTVTTRPLSELRQHPENPRNGDTDAIAESLRINGQYAPLVLARDGTILVGNHRYQAALSLGWDTMETITLDLDPLSPEAIRIMLADNRTSDLAQYDEALLLSLLEDVGETLGTGYTENDLDDLRKLADDPGLGDSYTQAVNVPQYEPVGPCPAVRDLYDTTRTTELVESIAVAVTAGDVPEDVARFLTAAAHRHTRFDYRLAAEFYPHATPEVQALMEASAMVIVDTDNAIRDGYLRLSEFLDTAEDEARNG